MTDNDNAWRSRAIAVARTLMQSAANKEATADTTAEYLRQAADLIRPPRTLDEIFATPVKSALGKI